MLTIIGIVALVVFTIQVYKTAAGTGRNAAAWAAITAVIGISIQFVFPVIIGIAIGIYYAATGTPVDRIEIEMFGLLTIISILGIVLSLVGMWLVTKHVSKVIDDDPRAVAPPPPPPTFDQGS